MEYFLASLLSRLGNGAKQSLLRTRGPESRVDIEHSLLLKMRPSPTMLRPRRQGGAGQAPLVEQVQGFVRHTHSFGDGHVLFTHFERHCGVILAVDVAERDQGCDRKSSSEVNHSACRSCKRRVWRGRGCREQIWKNIMRCAGGCGVVGKAVEQSIPSASLEANAASGSGENFSERACSEGFALRKHVQIDKRS